MSELNIHTVRIGLGSVSPTQQDRISQWCAIGLTNAVGGSAGATVSTVVAVPVGAGLPASNYFVDVELSQAATCWITAKSATGFTVNIAPLVATNTLAAGTFNVNVTY